VDRFAEADALVMSAAVTDYRAARAREGKTKDAAWALDLEKVPNILDQLAARKGARVMVGFAAETGDPEPEGARKLAARGLDLLVANDVGSAEGGFASTANRAVLMFPDGRRDRLPLLPKRELAERILDAVEPLVGAAPAGNAAPTAPSRPA
jgi:phosphopantothenoylcysteine decarboxylase/phosphopantothenate--cysteine ligase